MEKPSIESFFKEIADVPSSELSKIKKIFYPKVLKKNSYFIRAGEIPDKVGFNVSGLFRYLFIDENGKQIIKHDFYRRQDYPLCYEITHYVAIYRVSEIKKLNKQLFNDDTTWWDIEDKLDVDYEKDFIQKGVLKND